MSIPANAIGFPGTLFAFDPCMLRSAPFLAQTSLHSWQRNLKKATLIFKSQILYSCSWSCCWLDPVPPGILCLIRNTSIWWLFDQPPPLIPSPFLVVSSSTHSSTAALPPEDLNSIRIVLILASSSFPSLLYFYMCIFKCWHKHVEFTNIGTWVCVWICAEYSGWCFYTVAYDMKNKQTKSSLFFRMKME